MMNLSQHNDLELVELQIRRIEMEEWKKSVITNIKKKVDQIIYRNYRGMSLLSTSFGIVSNIMLSMLCPYIGEITADHLGVSM
jgi:hypothetical protein